MASSAEAIALPDDRNDVTPIIGTKNRRSFVFHRRESKLIFENASKTITRIRIRTFPRMAKDVDNNDKSIKPIRLTIGLIFIALPLLHFPLIRLSSISDPQKKHFLEYKYCFL